MLKYIFDDRLEQQFLQRYPCNALWWHNIKLSNPSRAETFSMFANLIFSNFYVNENKLHLKTLFKLENSSK